MMCMRAETCTYIVLMALRQPCHINKVLSNPLPGHASMSILPTIHLWSQKRRRRGRRRGSVRGGWKDERGDSLGMPKWWRMREEEGQVGGEWGGGGLKENGDESVWRENDARNREWERECKEKVVREEEEDLQGEMVRAINNVNRETARGQKRDKKGKN